MKDVRQGKFFEVELADADPATAKARVTEMADKLLANPVIESYRVEVLRDNEVLRVGRRFRDRIRTTTPSMRPRG